MFVKRLIIILIALILIAPSVYAHHSSTNLEIIADSSSIVKERELVDESEDDPLTKGEMGKKLVNDIGIIPEDNDIPFEDPELEWNEESTETALKELNLILTDFGIAEKTSGIIRDLSSSIDKASDGISEFDKEMQMRNLEDLRNLIAESGESGEEQENAMALVEQVRMFFDNPMIIDMEAKEPRGIEELDPVQMIRQGISEVRQILNRINSENKEAIQFDAMSLLKEIKSFTDSAKLDDDDKERFNSQIEKLKFLIRSAESSDIKQARLMKKKAATQIVKKVITENKEYAADSL